MELTQTQFETITNLVYEHCGIFLKDGKEALVRARLMKRLRVLNLDCFDTYLRFLSSSDGQAELHQMIDVLTTNKTSFFREIAHFHFLRDRVLPQLTDRRLRFWSAACSSGEEPYSLAILLREHVKRIDQQDVLILATDISTRMLEKAKKGIYSPDTLEGIPSAYGERYFQTVSHLSGGYRVTDNVRSLVRFAHLNLMEPWPMKGPFHAIFCRNVMIYFDRDTQQRLVNRLWKLLATGGYLFVGHSEGLSAISHPFQYIQPAVYQK